MAISEDLRALAGRAYSIMSADGGDLDQLDELMAPGFVDHDPDPDQSPGAEGVKESFRGLRTSFPDLRMTPEAIYVDGDTVIARVRITGTHGGEFAGIPPTGKQIDVQVIDIVRTVDGKAAERWGVYDGLAMMQQLGQVPGH